jgi:hypothetical protein
MADLCDVQPAIDREMRAGHIAGCRRGKEQRQSLDLIGLAEPSQWHLAADYGLDGGVVHGKPIPSAPPVAPTQAGALFFGAVTLAEHTSSTATRVFSRMVAVVVARLAVPIALSILPASSTELAANS